MRQRDKRKGSITSLLPSPTFLYFFYQTAIEQLVSFEVVPMEYCTSVKKASMKVTVVKTVIIINHLAARAKSQPLWNCKIHFAIEQK